METKQLVIYLESLRSHTEYEKFVKDDGYEFNLRLIILLLIKKEDDPEWCNLIRVYINKFKSYDNRECENTDMRESLIDFVYNINQHTNDPEIIVRAKELFKHIRY